MSSEFRIIPRTEIGLPSQVLSSKGNPRPVLSGCRFLTIHYTGVDVFYGDFGDTAQEILAIQNWAVFSGKPWEYNFVIDQDDTDVIYEYAGTYQAAHSAGENDIAMGILILNGTKERMTDIQVRKVQWLRSVFLYFGALAPDAETRPHRAMPDAKTACPGDHVLSRWDEILQPYAPPVEPPPIDLTHLKDGLYYIQPNDSPWKVSALMYGTGAEWPKIVEANTLDTMMNVGERWKIPRLGGVDLAVLSGEGPWTIIKRAGQKASQASVEEFYKWNGSSGRVLRPGDRVFVRYT